jgi:PST family polysaccharide transporter
MSKAATLTKNFGALSVIQAANFFIPFITLPIIVRIIGPDKFGVLNFLVAVVTYFILLINYGFDYTATRTIAQNRDDQAIVNKTFSKVLWVKTVLFIVSVALFAIMMAFVPQLQREWLVSVLSFAGCIANVLMPNWLFQGMEQLQKAAVFNLLAKLLFSVAMIVVIRQKQDYWLYALLTSISQIAVGVALFIYGMRKFHIRLVATSWKEITGSLYEDRMVFLSTLMINLYTTSNIVILGFMKPDSEVGIFTAASRVIGVIQTLTLMPLSQTLYPHIGKSFAQNREEGLTEVKKVFPVVSLLALVIAVILFITAPLAIHILFGRQFDPAIHVLRLLCINPIFISISNLLGTQTLLNLKNDKAFLVVTAIGSLACILLNLALIPRYSYYGTAIAWVLTEGLIALGMGWMLRRSGISLFDKAYFNLFYLKTIARKLVKGFRQKLKLS